MCISLNVHISTCLSSQTRGRESQALLSLLTGRTVALHTNCVSVLLLYNYFAQKMIVRKKTEERASQFPKM